MRAGSRWRQWYSKAPFHICLCMYSTNPAFISPVGSRIAAAKRCEDTVDMPLQLRKRSVWSLLSRIFPKVLRFLTVGWAITYHESKCLLLLDIFCLLCIWFISFICFSDNTQMINYLDVILHDRKHLTRWRDICSRPRGKHCVAHGCT